MQQNTPAAPSKSRWKRLPSLRRRERIRRGGHGPVQIVSRFRRPNFVHRHIDVVIPSLPDAFDGYRIVQLTDLHFGPAIAYHTVMAGIAHTMAIAPDLIVLTGDYVTDELCDTLLPDALSQLNAPDGVWAVMGNHDHWTDIDGVRGVLASSGVQELCNTHTPIIRDDTAFWLAGVDSVYVGQQNLDAALCGIPDGAPTVLLVHEPDFADEAAASGRVSLQLSGHAHGGSLQIPLLGVPVMSNFLKYARKYPYGMYRPNGMWLYTSAGIGRGHLPRVNALPEVTEITLWQRPLEVPEIVRPDEPVLMPYSGMPQAAS
jgi:uncharacterized protein